MPDHANEQGGSYRVGYGQPPQKSQFKKGQSGNPKGRPPKKSQVDIDIEALWIEPVEVSQKGKRLAMPKREVALRTLLKKAVEEQHTPSILYLLERFRMFGAISPKSIDSGGVVVVPDSMPVQMGSLLLKKFGRPPWTDAEKAVGRKAYLEGQSDIDRQVDELVGYEDL